MSANVTEAIDGLTSAVTAGVLVMGFATTLMVVAILAIPAIWLTITMFRSRSMMLGFPSAIFWALLGGAWYLVPTALDPAPDMGWTVTWWRLISFACFGMAIFSMLAAYALRTKKEEAQEGDQYFDEGGDKDVQFIDEGGSSEPREGKVEDDRDKPSRRIRDIRERADRRRKRWD